jgi:hypothetical protein
MRPRHHPHRLGLGAVRGDRAQLVGIGTHHIRQGVRISGITFGPGDTVPLPVAGHLQRVDRIHPVPSSDQRRHPRPAVSLDPDQHLSRLAILTELLTDHRVQPGHPGHPLRQPHLGQPPPRGVHQLHIMMGLGPVIPHEHQHALLILIDHPCTASGRTISDLMNQCSRHTTAGTTSHQRSTLPTHQQGHDLSTGLQGPGRHSAHLPAAWRGVCRMANPLALISPRSPLVGGPFRAENGVGCPLTSLVLDRVEVVV